MLVFAFLFSVLFTISNANPSENTENDASSLLLAELSKFDAAMKTEIEALSTRFNEDMGKFDSQVSSLEKRFDKIKQVPDDIATQSDLNDIVAQMTSAMNDQIPDDLVRKSQLDEMVTHMKSLLSDISPQFDAEAFQTELSTLDSSVSDLLSRTANLDVINDLTSAKEKTTLSLKEINTAVSSMRSESSDYAQQSDMDEVSVAISRLSEKLAEVDQKSAIAGIREEVREVKSQVGKIQKDISRMKSTIKRVEKINDNISVIQERQSTQEKLIKSLKREHQKNIETQFAKLKADLKEELKKDVHGFFASIAIELGFLFALIRDSYVHVVYDLSARAGMNKSTVDAMFQKADNAWSWLISQLSMLLAFAEERFYVLSAYLKREIPKLTAALSEHAAQFSETAGEYIAIISRAAGENISNFSSTAGEHISNFSSTAGENLSIFAARAQAFIIDQVDRLRNLQLEDVNAILAQASDSVKEMYSSVKAIPAVSNVFSIVLSKLVGFFPDKPATEIEQIMDLSVMILASTVAVAILFFLVHLFIVSLRRLCCGPSKAPKQNAEKPVVIAPKGKAKKGKSKKGKSKK